MHPTLIHNPALAVSFPGFGTIFVHAGAGFHSVQNEPNHLEACNAASSAAMSVLRAGGTAVDAVEMAVRILEDREITNAGFGSNLTLDGVVECDATVVDHLGRSGGVGAVSQIRNPVSLARALLDHSLRPLSLRRVPPNLLVSMGATNFAQEIGMQVSSGSELISRSAHERWLRWRQELKAAASQEKYRQATTLQGYIPRYATEPFAQDAVHSFPSTKGSGQGFLVGNHQLRQTPSGFTGAVRPQPSTTSMAQSQADTPTLKAAKIKGFSESPSSQDSPNSQISNSKRKKGLKGGKLTSLLPATRRLHVNGNSETDGESEHINEEDDTVLARLGEDSHSSRADGSSDFEPDGLFTEPRVEFGGLVLQTDLSHAHYGNTSSGEVDVTPTSDHDDRITDTVGAIAIDNNGHIAAASSSGGIGMKHRGRIGPAALVGIGTAVIPINPLDSHQASVAVVTSGTGEHMATTMASSICAERIYTSTIKSEDGGLQVVDEDTALKSFIQNDFMSHPGVKESISVGAIGVLAMKRTLDGVTLLFAHNTDSFAMASMTTQDFEPKLTMSRNNGNGDVAFGGRYVAYPDGYSAPSEGRH
ncbi:MAG: hypothetical protein M1814_006652 [Vezdaea aestivalis]|nr:MAG: hypothetical protein M1814_006652 [Vezdaea aestivalis]